MSDRVGSSRLRRDESPESQSLNGFVPEPSRTAPRFQLGYRPWLDGLRGAAILLVLLFHLHLIPGGSLGVDVFFVLSGFLITALLVEEWERNHSIRLRRFYLRRALRLVPAFLTLLLVYSAVVEFTATGNERAEFRRELVVAACYLSNWIGVQRLGYTWSLSVEEQFYLVWPIALYGMLRSGLSRRRIMTVVCLGILICAGWRIVVYAAYRSHPELKAAGIMRMYAGSDTRADSLLVGCLVGLAATSNLLPRSRRFLFWSGIAAAISAVTLGLVCWKRCLDHSQFYHGLFTGVALMVGIIIVRLLSGPVKGVSWLLESRPLTGVGRISYSLYLWHAPIIVWLSPMELGAHAPFNTLMVACLSILVAIASYYGIEKPFLKYKAGLRVSSQRSDEPPTLDHAAEKARAAA